MMRESCKQDFSVSFDYSDDALLEISKFGLYLMKN